MGRGGGGGGGLPYWTIQDVPRFRVYFSANIPEPGRRIRQKFLNREEFHSNSVPQLGFLASLCRNSFSESNFWINQFIFDNEFLFENSRN